MIILDAKLVNEREFRLNLEKKSKAVKGAVSDGIKKAIEDFAQDLIAHTPVKSGRAQRSVEPVMKSALEGRVGWNPRDAWYMRIVDLSGARPHLIVAKGRMLKNRSRALSRSSQSKRTLREALRSAGLSAETLSALSARGGSLRTLALALNINGRYVSRAMHPGMRSRLVLRSRIEANKDRITATIWGGVQEKVIKS